MMFSRLSRKLENWKAYFVAAIVVAFFGCDKRGLDVPYAELPEDAVVASVDGVNYTKSDLERDCGIMADLLKLAQIDEPEILPIVEPESYRRSMVERIIDRELLVKEADRRRIALSPADLERHQNQFAADFPGNVPVHFRTLIDFLGSRAGIFRANLRRDALAKKLRMLVRDDLTERVRVTRDDAMREQDRVRKLNDEIAVTNAAIRKAATKAWKSVRAGNDFDVVGRRLLSLRTDVTYVADGVETNDAWVKAPVGEVLPPIELGDCIVFVKAIGTDAEGHAHFGKIAYSLCKPQEVPTIKAAMNSISEERVDSAYSAWLGELRRQAKIYNWFCQKNQQKKFTYPIDNCP